MERASDRPSESVFIEAGQQEKLKPFVSVRRGLEHINPDEGWFPAELAVKQATSLAALLPSQFDGYEMFRQQRMPAAESDREAYRIYDIFRTMGFSVRQVRELCEAARLDVEEHREDWDSHKIRLLNQLYRAEQAEVDALIAHGAVQAQLADCASAVIRHVLDNALAPEVRRDFTVLLHGPVAGFIADSYEFKEDEPSFTHNLGVYHVTSDSVKVRLSEDTLERGELQSRDLNTAIHELVHATSPADLKFGRDSEGMPTHYARIRSGFMSMAGKSTRRAGIAVLPGLNEGITESIAQDIGMSRGIAADEYPSYQRETADVATLASVLGVDKLELYRIYHSESGVLELGKLLRDRTALGRHGLALFDLFDRGAHGGFAAFMRELAMFHAGLETKTVELQLGFVERPPKPDGTKQPIYPPLTASFLVQSFPFVMVVGDSYERPAE